MAQPYPDHPNLRGNFAPLRMECDLPDVIVSGDMPLDLDISYYRNGPDPQFPPRGPYHWFGGDGMLHMFNIAKGQVGYRNRWVRTTKFEMEREAGESLFSPMNPMGNDKRTHGVETNGLANTNIVFHGDKLLALEEGHAPFELNRHTLESIGPHTFEGKYSGPMTAHPKMDEQTGEMLFFGYMAAGPFSPEISFQVVNAAGELTRSEMITAPYPAMVHDFMVTKEHVLFPIFPLTGSLERAMQGQPAFAWEPGKGTHIGVMPRNGSAADVRWFETDPCFVFHPMNAYTDGETIRAHVMQFEEAPLFPHLDGKKPDREKANARLCEWEIDLRANSNGIKRTYLDDITGEFPRLDERLTGLEYRHGYYAASTRKNGGDGFNSVVHQDLVSGSAVRFDLPDGDFTGEPVFVPKSVSAAEGEGYLLSLLYRGAENRSDLAVFDAQNVSDGPVALAQLPHRIPFGFHGNWCANNS